MRLSSAELSELAGLAITAATEAGQMIAESRPREIHRKAGGASLASQVVTEVDRRSEDIILGFLRPTLQRFELGLLTEEQDDDRSRLEADYFWCIDPLDGTLAFVEGSPGYAVSIALVDRSGKPWIGVIYDPVEATLLHAISGTGVFRGRRRWPGESVPINDPAQSMLSVFADRSFLVRNDHQSIVDSLDQMAQGMGLNGVVLDASSGAVMNARKVLEHPPACYFKFPASKGAKPTGGGSLWDFAAMACLFHECGAVATDIYGEPLDLNRADSSYMNHRGVLFATDDLLATRLRALYKSSS